MTLVDLLEAAEVRIGEEGIPVCLAHGCRMDPGKSSISIRIDGQDWTCFDCLEEGYLEEMKGGD